MTSRKLLMPTNSNFARSDPFTQSLEIEAMERKIKLENQRIQKQQSNTQSGWCSKQKRNHPTTTNHIAKQQAR